MYTALSCTKLFVNVLCVYVWMQISTLKNAKRGRHASKYQISKNISWLWATILDSWHWQL